MSNLFTAHSRSWQGNRYVYPVISRRSKGLSIGINLNPDKVCNFGCLYCCVDRTEPPSIRDVDLGMVRDELDRLLAAALSGDLFTGGPFEATPLPLRRLNDVAFSGDGEPTTYARFGEACRVAAEALLSQGAGDGRVRIVVITNATLLHRPAVRDALAYLDTCHGEIWAKLDAGTEAYFRAVERTQVPFQRVLDNIRDAGRVRPIVIQSMFLRLGGAGPTSQEIKAYLQRLRELTDAGCQIRQVQVYTVARRTASPEVGALEDERLDEIAGAVCESGILAEAFHGTTS